MAPNGALPISSRLPAPCPNGRNCGLFPPAIFKSLQSPQRRWTTVSAHRRPGCDYWAEHYLPSDPQLEKLKPFTSEDIDFKGGSEDVQRIARQLELTPGYPPKVQMTALAGTIPFHIGNLKSNIEIVRRIPGVSGSVDALAIQAEWDGKTLRVLDPISLLACKLELVAGVPQ